MNRVEGSSLRLVAVFAAWTILAIVPSPAPATACTSDAECDDGNSCTIGEVCSGGSCQPGTSKPNGSACNDGNSCTLSDKCMTGLCIGTIQPDAAICSDGNFCTTGDVCQAGSCVGSPILDGILCEDGNTCTLGDTCQAGQCTSGTARDDGEFCVDGDLCTGPDTCQGGVCVAGPRDAFDQDLDGDCDAKEDTCGCDKTNPREVCPLPNRLVGRGGSGNAEVLMEWHTPTTRKVLVATDDSCATAGSCQLDVDGAMRCTKGKIRDACTVDADCNQPAEPATCRLIVNWADRPDLTLLHARMGRVDLLDFPAARPACSSKYDFTVDPTRRTNRVRLKAMGTANGRVRRESDRFRIFPVLP
jgi:hypothetical protein